MSRTFVTKSVEAEPGVGETLRQGREGAGHTVEELAARTRIQPRFLRALEEGKWKDLPEDVYVRSFVKGVAGALGIGSDELLVRLDEELALAARGGGRGKFAATPPRPPRAGFVLTERTTRAAAAALLVAAAALVLTFQIRALIRAPALLIDFPPEDFTTSSSIVRVRGRTVSETALTVNSIPIAPRSDGTFEEPVALEPGVNLITITAKKRRSRTAAVERHVIFEPPPQVIPTSTY